MSKCRSTSREPGTAITPTLRNCPETIPLRGSPSMKTSGSSMSRVSAPCTSESVRG